MAGYGGIWRDMAGYGGIPGDTGRYREIPGDTRYGQIRADTGRYGEMRGDARRYGEIQSDIGEIHQDTAKKPSTLGLRVNSVRTIDHVHLVVAGGRGCRREEQDQEVKLEKN
jgi:hypothetical protein